MSLLQLLSDTIAAAPIPAPHHVSDVVAATQATSYEPSPNPPIPDELTKKVRDVLGIAKWFLGPAGVLGLIIFGLMMAISSRRNEGDVQLGLFGKIILGVLIGSSAVGIVGFVIA